MKTISSTLLKSLLIGAAYAIAVAVGGMIVNLLGFNLPETDNPTVSLIWFFVGGVIAGLSLGSVASSIPAARTRHFFVWGSLIFLNIASVAIEGYFFAPKLIGDALPVLPQELHVAPREREYAEPRAQFFGSAVMLIEKPERDEQRSQQDGVRQRLRVLSAAVAVEGGERLPEHR